VRGIPFAALAILAAAIGCRRTDLPVSDSARQVGAQPMGQLQLPTVTPVLSSDSVQVCFGVPKGLVDWNTVADSALGTAFVQNPPVKELRQHYMSEWGGSSNFPFLLSSPAAVSAVDWMVLRETGFSVVHPTVLRGRVAYSVDKQFVVHSKAIEGTEACAPMTTAGGGFVLSGVGSKGWSVDSGPPIAPLPAQQTNSNRFSATIDSQAYSFAVNYETTVLASRLVRRGSEAFLLVEWKDIGFCTDHYHLFEVRPAGVLRLVSESVGDCRGD
jgi:hypothetical protein